MNPLVVDPESLCFEFLAPEAGDGSTAGTAPGAEAGETAKTAQVEVVLRLPLRPRVVYRAHVQDLAFEVARRRADLEGRDLDVAVCFRHGGDGCLHNWLVAIDPADPAGRAASAGRLPGEVAAVPVLPETLDLRPVRQVAEQRGLPLGGTFVRVGVGDSRRPETARQPARSLFGTTTPPSPEGLRLRVPSISRSEEPALNPAASLFDHGLPPLLLPESGFERLVQDEIAFAESRADRWTERAWWLLGRPVRLPAGTCVQVDLVAPMEGLAHAGPGRFEIGPTTWDRLRAAQPDRAVVGWLHSHSVRRLLAAAEKANGVGKPPEEPKAAGSGLFLSAEDVYASRFLGFRAPYMVTAVLDSDSALGSAGETQGTENVLGAWGWLGGHLAACPVVLTHMPADGGTPRS